MNYFIGDEVEGNMFILDDATPLGIEFPKAYLDVLKRNNRKVEVLDAAQLAEDLLIIADERPVTLLGRGGILVGSLLRQKGFVQPFGFVDVERRYAASNGQVEISYLLGERSGEIAPVFVDDVIASGNTLNFALRELEARGSDAWALVLSGNTRGGYREAAGSTVQNTNNVYAARQVSRRDGSKSAILSARYLLRGVRDNPGYRRYLMKYVGADGMVEVMGILRGLDLGPYEMLYAEPRRFLEAFGRRLKWP